MAIEPFGPADFRVFDLPGLADRMAAMRARIRPKLKGLGSALAPDLAKLIGHEMHAHVAKHARRTVNPPDDMWVAFGPDRRWDKKALHFSHHAVRFLFEVGPEFAAKSAWARASKRAAPRLWRVLAQSEGLAWFRTEHAEAPAARLGELDPGGWTRLGEELTRTRDGQLALGRRVDAAAAARWSALDYARAARQTFGGLRDCFRLR